MKLGVFTHLSWHPQQNQNEVFYNSIEQVKFAEAMGFQGAWFAEHHFTRYSMGSSVAVILGHIAACTSEIRLGSAVFVPLLHNPVRLAEDIATLDILSGGRIDVGFGRGTYGYEYAGYGVLAEGSQQRFRNSVLDIQNLWMGNDTGFHSEYDVDVNLVPHTYQEPHPPIFIAATKSHETLDLLIDYGFKICIAVVQDTKDAINLINHYKKACLQNGRPSYMNEVPFFRYVHVALTEREADENVKLHLDWIQDVMQWRRHLTRTTEVGRDIDEWKKIRSDPPPSYEYIKKNRAFIGTPESVIRQISELKSHGIEYFGCNFSLAGLSQEKILASMRLFDQKVRPFI